MTNYLEIAGRLGKQYAEEHPYADGATAWVWACRLPTKAESLAFFRSWQKASR